MAIKIAKAVRKLETKVKGGVGTIHETRATCSCCGATVTWGQYGREEECPQCDAYIIWGDD